MGLLDYLFPKTCVACGKFGAYLCKNCAEKIHYLDYQFCPECTRPAINGQTHPLCHKALGLDGLFCLTYFTFPINKIIHALKYRLTTDLLSEVELKIALEKKVFGFSGTLVPIPLHWQRKNYRGFNQAEVLGRIYAAKLNLDFSSEILTREVKTKQQVGLKRHERLSNLKGAFRVEGEVGGKSLVVFDDVWTTGATLRNASQVLKRAGANKVWGFTLARSH